MKTYTNLKRNNLKEGEVEFEAQISIEELEKYSAKVLIGISADFELPGFRKGTVPHDMIKQHVNEFRVFEDAANDALRNSIQEIVLDEKLMTIGYPQVTVTKIALNNPVEFKVRFALMPEITLPDYKKIGKEIFERKGEGDSEEVSEKEMQEAIERIQKMVVASKANMETASVSPEAKATTGDFSSAKATADEAGKLPELTDEFVNQLGPFKTVEEFKAEIKRELVEEKKYKIQQVKREEMINEIIKQSKLDIPKSFLDQELQNFTEHRNADLKQAGITLENYLKEIKKTAEEFEKEESAAIEQQIKTQFVLAEIRDKEKLTASDAEIHANEEFLKMRYPDKDHEYLHRMSEALIIQKRLFDMLEGKMIKSASEIMNEELGDENHE